MSSNVPGFGAAARLIPLENWNRLAAENGGEVKIKVLLGALSFEPNVASPQWVLTWQEDVVVPRPSYFNERVDSIRKKKLNPNAQPFFPKEKRV